MDELSAIERLILNKLKRGPQPSQRFNMAQGVVSGLIRKGLIARQPNPNGGAHMLDLSIAGCAALGLVKRKTASRMPIGVPTND